MRCVRARWIFGGVALTFVLNGLLPVGAAAQTVRGRVLDDATGTPLSGARISLHDAQSAEAAGSVSNEAGLFELRGPAAGTYRIQVGHLGHSDYASVGFHLSDEEFIDIEIRMGIEAIPLEPLVVLARRLPASGRLARFEQRMNDPARAGGYFISQEEIERRVVSTPSRLVLRVPGTAVAPIPGPFDRSMITLRRGCQARLFVDGVPLPPQQSIDDLLDTQSIGGVEVYPSPLTVPIAYQDATPPLCGVVLFWTREGEVTSGDWGFKRIAIGTGMIAAILLFGLFS